MRSQRWSSQGAASTGSTRRPQAGASGSSPTIGARRAGPTLPDRRAPRGWPARQNPKLCRGVGGRVRERLGTGSFLPSPTVLPALAFSSASGVRSPGVAPRGPLRRLGILSRLGRAPGALYAARRGSSPPCPSPLAPSAHPVRIPAPCTTPPRRRPAWASRCRCVTRPSASLASLAQRLGPRFFFALRGAAVRQPVGRSSTGAAMARALPSRAQPPRMSGWLGGAE